MQPFYVFTLGSTFATAFEYSFVCLFPFHGIGNIQVSKRDLGTPQVISNFNVSQFIMIEKSLIITVSLGPTLSTFWSFDICSFSHIQLWGPRKILFASFDKEFGQIIRG